MTNGLKSALTNKKTGVKALDFIIVSAITLIFFLCPLFFTGFVAQGMGFEKMMLFYFLVLIGTVAWVTKGITEGELKLKRTPLDWPIMALVVSAAVSTILSSNYKDSLIGAYGNSAKSLAAVVIFALFYYLIVNNINVNRIKLIFWSLVCSSGLIAVYSLLQLMGIFILPFAITKAISFNTLGSASALTVFIASVLPLFVVGAAQLKEMHPGLKNNFIAVFIKILLLAISLVSLAVLALLKGFAFLPAAIIGIVIVLMFFLSKIIKISQNNLVIPLAAFLLLIILLVLGNFNFVTLNLPAEVSLSRGASWDIARASLAQDPFFGSGPSTFYYSFTKYKDLAFNNSPLWNVRFDSASGALFELLANIGILGALLFTVVVLIAISICFIALIKTAEKEVHSILLALFSGFIAVFILSLLFSFSSGMILFAVLISTLAVSSAIIVYPEKFNSINLSFRTSPKYALALAAIFLCVSAGVVVLFTLGIKMYLADVYVNDSLRAATLEEKIEKLEKAIVLAPYRDVYYINLANNYMALANREAQNNNQGFENYLSMSIERGKKAVEIAPNKASGNEALALIYENSSFYIRGALEWAETYYNKVADLDPNNPTPYTRLALINMAKARTESDQAEKEYFVREAIKKYDEAIAKKSDLAAAYYGKSVAYESIANNGEAIEQLKKAVIADRNNVNYRFELGRLYFNRGVVQPNISQTAAEEITVGENEEDELSVQASQPSVGAISRNEDLNMAEQAFLSITQAIPNHANSLYSLAVLYQKLGETGKMRTMVDSLLNILTEESDKQTVRSQFPGF